MRRFLWVETEEIDAISRDFFIHALVDMGACYILYDSRSRCMCITGLPAIWGSLPHDSPTDLQIFGADIARRLEVLRNSLQEAGDHGAFEIDLGGKGIFEFRCRKVSIPAQGLYFIVAIADKTEERKRERTLRALLLEVSHRSKNLMAVVQGIASQTARFSGSLDGFLQKFRGRLYALSKAQDIVTDSEWRGVGFMDLLKVQLELTNSNTLGQITTRGENVLLSPNAALHIGLALHELIVNSINYGGSSPSSPSIEISCSLEQDAEKQFITITWQETLNAASNSMDPHLTSKFGSTVLEKVVPVSVNGTALYTLDSGGISYALRFPDDNHG